MNCHEASALAAALRILRGVALPGDEERLVAVGHEREQVERLARAMVQKDDLDGLRKALAS